MMPDKKDIQTAFRHWGRWWAQDMWGLLFSDSVAERVVAAGWLSSGRHMLETIAKWDDWDDDLRAKIVAASYSVSDLALLNIADIADVEDVDRRQSAINAVKTVYESVAYINTCIELMGVK